MNGRSFAKRFLCARNRSGCRSKRGRELALARCPWLSCPAVSRCPVAAHCQKHPASLVASQSVRKKIKSRFHTARVIFKNRGAPLDEFSLGGAVPMIPF